MVDLFRRDALAALGTVALPTPSTEMDDESDESGERKLTKASLPDAERVVVALPKGISVRPPLAGYFDDLLAEQLIGRRVWEGEAVPCQLNDEGALILPVRETDPDRMVVVREDTTVGIRERTSTD